MNKLINSLIIAAALAAISGVMYIQSDKAIHQMAIDGCLQTARLQTKTANKENITVPENYWYNYCMKEKGYKK